MLRFPYVRSPGDVVKLTDVSKNVCWINTTLTNTNISKADDLKQVVKMRPGFGERDDPVWVTSTTLE